MMDGNKDEAERCRQMAINEYNSGNIDKAIRLLHRSERMYASDENKKLIAQYTKNDESNQQSGNADTSRDKSATTARRATSTNNRTNDGVNGDDSSAEVPYTEEQVALCRVILNTRDYYKVLNIERTATDDAIKKAYKKLALQLHPDKNKAPNAEEAFKKVSKAFQCLLDPSKRKIYDTNGDEENIPRVMRHHYEADYISPEELFNAFFGGNFVAHQRRVERRRVTPERNQNPLGLLIQILPFLAFVLIPLLSSMFKVNEKQSFSLHRTYEFTRYYKTHKHEIPFYAANDLDENYPLNSLARRRLEDNVELTHFQKRCEMDRQDLQNKMSRATSIGSWSELNRLRNIRLTSCDMYRSIYGSLY